MIEIRLQGTLKECNEVIEQLKKPFVIFNISKTYKNKGKQKRQGEFALIRVYMDAEVRQEEDTVEKLQKAKEELLPKKYKQELKEMLESIAYDEQIRKNFIKELGKRIAEERSKGDVSIGEFSVLCGISESCLYNVERGRGDIRTTNLIAICLALDITLDDLVPPQLYNPRYQ